ncbi:MAG: glycosyltransferase family 2 protein [Candidatus Saccharimonadales bacterium]
MDSYSRVAVVVLNYKGIEDTVECIDSLATQTYRNIAIVAVENGSHDGSAEKFKELEKQYGKKLVTIYNDKNLGFDGGANTGIRWALDNKCDYVALLNNDAVADKDWVKNLVTAAKKHKSGLTTGLLLREDGKTIDSTGEFYSKWGLGFPRNRGDKASEAPKGGFVFGASGGATLFSVPMLREIGMFDEDFFAYYEDNDISFRAQLAGWKVYYEPSAIAYHKLMQTSGRMRSGFATYQTFKNLPLVFIKNVPLGLLFPIGIRFYLAYWLILGHAIVRGRGWPAIKGAAMSIVLGIKKLPSRWRIQHRKKVTTEYIKQILWDDLPPDQTGLRKLRKLFIGK